MSDISDSAIVQRPPIVLTTMDCNRLSALLNTASEADPNVARFLHEEIERAEIARGQVAATSLVRMGSEVKFIEHDSIRIRRVKLVYPDEASNSHHASVLTAVGAALIGLGPGQLISWGERGLERQLTVLEVCSTSEQVN